MEKNLKSIIAVSIFCIIVTAGVWAITDAPASIMTNTKKIVTNTQSTAENTAKSPDISLHDFSYTVTKECNQNNEAAEIEILYKSEIVDTIETNYCLIDRVDFFGNVDGKILFSILPGGLGGDYIYPASFNVYEMGKNKKAKLISAGIVSTIGLDPQNKRIAFVKYENSVLNLHTVNLLNENKKNVPLSIQHTGQIGHLVFSPNGSKIAIEVGYGPEDARGEIYLFDTVTQKLTRQTTEKMHLKINNWKNENEVTWSEL